MVATIILRTMTIVKELDDIWKRIVQKERNESIQCSLKMSQKEDFREKNHRIFEGLLGLYHLLYSHIISIV